MSRKSVLMRRSGILDEPELPLRAYFLWVGSALMLLLLAADWALPAPLPSRVTDSHSTLPPIRIYTEMKVPDAVVMDTGGFGLRTTRAEDDIANDRAQAPEAEIASPAPSSDPRLRESLAQLPSDVQDHKSETDGPGDVAARGRRPIQARTTKQRLARHPALETSVGHGISACRERRPCRYASAPN
ncbi:hypothetical protein QA645_07090 [Bradyrhizobium sp. CIAT3101]|uniref:hypothetical protein n=1 Tax=Bradyrhizobium sp. CIAT3101 TaxID=439387 RepID=UPI0024B147B6|nr:hypothetical protein [Bradyrhizobium sp. CIAT3101]WFU82503.1 hypothetical protein QA645_07090 [Bradyrhizobium sp. CIAT3101]